MNPLFEKSVYVARRKELARKMGSGLLLFLGNNDAPMNYPANTYNFRQDSNFIYYFGLTAPSLAAVIDIDENRTILFGDDFTIDDIIWVGDQPSISTLAAQVGITESMPMSKLKGYLRQNASRTIHFTKAYRHDLQITLANLLQKSVNVINSYASIELHKAIIAMRSIKEAREIAEMEKAADMAWKLHTTVMRNCKPGATEHQLVGIADGIANGEGNGFSFPIILTQHGEIFHNTDHNVELQKGKLLLVDSGVEGLMNYCSDMTRTFPVSGKFTQKQKDIYEIVLKANMEGIKKVKPGTPYRDVHFAAAEIVMRGLKDLGLMKGDVQEGVRLGAHALFFPHGLGHQLGLDVHDMEGLGEDYVGYNEEFKRSNIFGTRNLRMARTLEPGMVMTVEPGIYFIPKLIELWRKQKHLADFINYDKLESYLDFGGIRIEDDVVVTAKSHRVLGQAVPKTVAELEAIVGKKH